MLIRQAEMEDDDIAEKLITKAIEHYKEAYRINPENKKLGKMVEMMS